MKSTINGIVILLFISNNMLAQPKFLQKETDNKSYITFAKFATDTDAQPLSKANELLKNLYSIRMEDEMKMSERRKPIEDEFGYTHQFYHQYYKDIKVEGGEFSVHVVKGNIESVLGNFHSIGDVSVVPKLSEAEALQCALKKKH